MKDQNNDNYVNDSSNKDNEIETSIKDFEASLNFLTRQYLIDKNFEILANDHDEIGFSSNIRFLHLHKFVYEKDIKITDKLLSVYSALYSTGTTLIIKLVSNGNQCDLYIGVKKQYDAAKSLKILKGAFEGNFPGTTFTKDSLPNKEIEKLNSAVFQNADEISCSLGVAALKNKEEDNFVQGIENLIIAMQGKEFSALFIAEPIKPKEIDTAKRFYENIYSQLYPLKEQTKNLSWNESIALTDGITETIGSTYTNSVSQTETESLAKGKNTSHTENSNPWIVKRVMNVVVGTQSKLNIPNPISYSLNQINNKSVSVANKVRREIRFKEVNDGQLLNTKATSKTKGTSLTKTSSSANTKSNSSSKSNSESTSNSEAKSKGSSRSIQSVSQNKTIVNILDKLDLQFDRLKRGESLGLWNTGAYFMSKEQQNSIVAANIYGGLIKGNDTGVEKSVVHTFTTHEDKENHSNLLEALKSYNLPTIKTKVSRSETSIKLATITNTAELCIQASMPHKSFVGLDVVETAPFGNNIKHRGDNLVSIGKLYNYEKEFDQEFSLDIEKFTGHIFVTGSTGSGKSNVTYNLVNNLIRKNIKFLVIEPAKGEYKDVFGNREDVNVYGTNLNHTKVLKINPFSFPESIHIHEHIDRFIEILNASWPMYAAMPAILKDAVEKVYESKGWDLVASENLTGKLLYPTFNDLAKILPKLIENSGYSQEMISNYSGALVTRVNSMTNGIFKLIFTDEEITSEIIFDNNAIVDLSRVASAETKSLIMGVLFMKLQEYRMTTALEANSKLKHVTIIEEAHNLLKKTSSEQGQESANLQGKSVEMISNAIAEMRTYGQGFILADQAPSLLDPSAIRNTNTKICLRLPSQDDRELVGKSMNLNDDQIKELAKLETGVAAVYQNDWQEAVLCKFNLFEKKESKFIFYNNKKVKVKIVKFLAYQLVESYNGNALDTIKLTKTSKFKDSSYISNRLLKSDIDEEFIQDALCKLLEVDTALDLMLTLSNEKQHSFYKALLLYKEILCNKWGFNPKDKNFINIVGFTIIYKVKKDNKYLPILNAYLSDIKNRNLNCV
ncbi:ATP-binding helicase, putative [Psychroflexus torquis ATCC 700755]|uniref:ATP-binding helicase, putative n=1 Tax=Psychroflexus torquis (strain ATCC 700755 / CIP 106069 / ACAM 623) TaxID=313595 RepID=K4IR02_PSYTT|nr:ATP-binding protein [Psychroflexus torquis]AFU67915.1 ATP-binding helicase, putative [Psychroflexus torquis ATCC 700755]